MILYNIVLGNLNLTPDSWNHITDIHGNHFIAKEDIRQRIRIDSKVDPAIYPELGELKPTWSTSNMQCFNILPGTRWVNNNRNMNPLLLANKENAEGKEQIVIYITVGNNYSITRFNTPHRILQTFHKKEVFQGCAVVLNTNERDTDNRIISISVYDKKKDQYTQFNISFIKNDLDKINIERKGITNKILLDKMKEQFKKFNNRYLGFKILTKPEELLTLTYITSPKFKDTITTVTKNINNPTIIEIDQEQLEGNNASMIFENIKNKFESERIRAVTLCGINLPLDVVRQLKLLYVFNYDVKNNVLSCKKSN